MQLNNLDSSGESNVFNGFDGERALWGWGVVLSCFSRGGGSVDNVRRGNSETDCFQLTKVKLSWN